MVPAKHAATVVPLRDGVDGLEILLLRRHARLSFAGGAWVFPGGHVDPEDWPTDAPDDHHGAARVAAVREAREEAGLELLLHQLITLSHWTTPLDQPKRFATWFFAAPAHHGAQVQVDGVEIDDHRWLRPQTALDTHQRGEIFLPIPTYATVELLLDFANVDAALTALAARPPEIVPVKAQSPRQEFARVFAGRPPP